MSDALSKLEIRIGYAFRARALLECAVTHPSFLQDNPGTPDNNQRLEFLGDAVVQLVVTEALFQLFPEDREGQLSRRRAVLTNGVFLAGLAREIGLDAALRLGNSEEHTGGRTRTAALEDALEALVGAVFLDSDLATARDVLLRLYGPLADRLAGVEDFDNPKGRLQEMVQPLHGNHALRYEVTATLGEHHAREYEVSVHLLDRHLGSGRGSSKKTAEEAAARAALVGLRVD